MTTIEAVREGRSRSTLRLGDPTDQAFLILRSAFTVAPIVFGLDKFFNVMVDWSTYLAPWLDRLVPGSATDFMRVVGVVEIAAGLLVAVRPRLGGLVVAGWLAGIVLNLLTAEPPRFYDIALRDVGLLLGALALERLAAGVQRARADASASGHGMEGRAR
jgi:hypothetical protein